MKFKRIIAFLKFLIIFIIIFFVITFLQGYFSDRIRLYIRQKAILHISDIVATTIQTEVLPSIDLENLVKTTNNENQQVESIFINTNQVNKIMALTSRSIADKMKQIDQNPDLVNLTMPLGEIISDVLFNDLGPNLSINIRPIGSVECDVITNYDHYGINNTLLTINIQAKVLFATLIPFQKDEVEVVTEIPIVVQIIQGEVPRYYYNNSNSEYIPQPIEVD
jgi:sporulation protein YunB